MIRSVLLVCLGNICRSPMAEGMLKQRLPGLRASSAGLMALVGHGADPIAVEMMAGLGIDISGHRARMINEAHVRDADLVLVMDSQQKQHILMHYPYVKGKVFRLGEQDIADPYQQGADVYRAVFEAIDSAVDDWVGRLRNIRQQQGYH